MLDHEIHGDAEKPWLLLLHAGGMTRREWDPFLPGLAQSYRVLTATALAHGASPQRSGIDLPSLAESTMDLLDALRVEQTSLLGSSMGGATALRLILRDPGRFNRVVLYRAGFRSSPGMQEALRQMATPANWRHWGLERWMRREHSPQGGPEAWVSVINKVAEAFARPDASLTETDLARIDQPVLIVAGDRDPIVPLADLVAMRRTIPSAALWVVPRAGHLMGMETWRRPAFLAEITRFLARGV